MKEINIARMIISKRKEKGITQEELANLIGVSIAAVSKWETAQSYPDISLLPQLAAYFNISIDDLMGYDPQMEKKDITKLYLKLYEDLNNKPFDEIIAECREAIKKYYSCFPLLLNMGDFLINAAAIHGDDEIFHTLVEEAKAIFVRVKAESDDVELVNMALYQEAICATILDKPAEVINLLGRTTVDIKPRETLIASAYQQLERKEEAEAILQTGIYQHILSAFELLVTYMAYCDGDDERFDEIVKRTLSLVEAFNINELRSPQIGFYAVVAQGYLEKQDTQKALDMLDRYAETVTKNMFGSLRGDNFFNLVDGWLSESIIATPATPNKAVNEMLAIKVLSDSFWDVLRDESRFREIVKRLEGSVR